MAPADSRMLRWLVRLALAVAVGAMGTLHWWQPALSWRHEPVSFYVHGDNPWLLGLALSAFGLAAGLLPWAVPALRTRARGAAWLVVFGLGMVGMAVVPSDRWFPWEGPVTTGGLVHAALAILAPPLLLVPMGRLWSSARWGERVAVAGYVLGLSASALSLAVGWQERGPPPDIGTSERLLAVAAVGWLAAALRRNRQ